MKRSIKASSFHLGTVTGRYEEYSLTIMVLPKPWKILDGKNLQSVHFVWETGTVHQTLMLYENQTLLIEVQDDVDGMLENLLDVVIKLSKKILMRKINGQSQTISPILYCRTQPLPNQKALTMVKTTLMICFTC